MSDAPTPRRSLRLRPLPAPFFGAVLLALVLGWLGGRASSSSQPATLASLSRNFATVERQVAPAVVKISVTSPGRSRRGFGLPPEVGVPSQPRAQHSMGSGLVLDPRGYIITNRHVINRAQRIEVSVPGDPDPYLAQLIGADDETDLALIKINASRPLAVARLGDSDRLAVGDWVVAIGSPFGLDDSVTAGIVSALHRAVDPDRQFESFIQTDAPINPGNSGGPLVNLGGEVVGINTAIYTDSDGYQGVGFALPSQLVEAVYPQLLHQGKVMRGSIGVYFEGELDPAVRRIYGLRDGVPISQLTPGGPAAAAGLKAGDVIVSVNGRALADGAAFSRAILAIPIGQQAQIGYLRAGRSEQAMVRVADRDQIFPESAAAPPASPPPTPDFGLSLADGLGGVEVTAVQPDSFADRIGLQRDDIIVELNRQPVRDKSALLGSLSRLRAGQDVAFAVSRPNGDGTFGRWLLGGTREP